MERITAMYKVVWAVLPCGNTRKRSLCRAKITPLATFEDFWNYLFNINIFFNFSRIFFNKKPFFSANLENNSRFAEKYQHNQRCEASVRSRNLFHLWPFAFSLWSQANFGQGLMPLCGIWGRIDLIKKAVALLSFAVKERIKESYILLAGYLYASALY